MILVVTELHAANVLARGPGLEFKSCGNISQGKTTYHNCDSLLRPRLRNVAQGFCALSFLRLVLLVLCLPFETSEVGWAMVEEE